MEEGLWLQMAQEGLARADAEGLSCAPASPWGVSTSALEYSPGIPHNRESLQSRFATPEVQGAAAGGGDREENQLNPLHGF